MLHEEYIEFNKHELRDNVAQICVLGVRHLSSILKGTVDFNMDMVFLVGFHPDFVFLDILYALSLEFYLFTLSQQLLSQSTPENSATPPER